MFYFPCFTGSVPTGGENSQTATVFFVGSKWENRNELYYLFSAALETGMRCGELRALQWKCVDFKNREINVEHTLVMRADITIQVHPKQKAATGQSG